MRRETPTPKSKIPVGCDSTALGAEPIFNMADGENPESPVRSSTSDLSKLSVGGGRPSGICRLLSPLPSVGDVSPARVAPYCPLLYR